MQCHGSRARTVIVTLSILVGVASGVGRAEPTDDEAPAPPAPSTAVAAAQEPAPAETPAPAPPEPAKNKVKFSGVLDAYIMHQFRGADGPITGRIYDFRVDTPTVALAWADIELTPPPGGFGFLVSLAVGDSADADHAGALDGVHDGEARYKNLQQVYATYKSKGGITADLGKFLSPYGFDTTKVILNPNYSLTLATFLVPNYMGGLRVTIPIKGMRDSFIQPYITTSIYHTRTSGLQEDNDQPSYVLRAKLTTPDGKFTYFPAFGFGKDKLSAPGSGAPGNERVILFDNWFIYNLSARDMLAAEYVYRSDDDRGGNYDLTGHGYGIYFRRQLTPKNALALRHSGVINRTEVFAPGTPGRTRFHVREVTATYEVKLTSALTTRLEFRHDWTDNEDAFGFLNDDDQPTAKSQDTLALAFLFTF